MMRNNNIIISYNEDKRKMKGFIEMKENAKPVQLGKFSITYINFEYSD